MRSLAHDLLEGRETGTRGFDVATAYVAAQFEGMGPQPLESGSYFQEVPFRRATPLDSILEVRAGDRSVVLAIERDFVVVGHPTRETYEAEAVIVLVGHGVRAPEFGHDDSSPNGAGEQSGGSEVIAWIWMGRPEADRGEEEAA